MGLIIKKPGILTTIQDLGRTGAQKFGLNPAGVMDRAAARTLNVLLGNAESDAVLEMHFPACVIEFETDVMIAIGGADFGAQLNGEPLRNWSSMLAEKGATLSFAKRSSGNRAYVAVSGGLNVPEWRGSRSTNLVAGLGGMDGRKLSAGDVIQCEESPGYADRIFTVGHSLIPRYSRFPTVRIVTGSEFEYLSDESERTFLSEGFTLTNDCNRMGYRLSGKLIHLLHPLDMVSTAVSFGTIQLLPDGQLIILMADHQTSGGYPRIGSVISADLPLVAQCGPGDGVSFQMVTIDEAERLALRFETELSFLRVGGRLQALNASYRS